MKITSQEKELIELIRNESKPHTRIEIKIGPQGGFDSWLVHTSRKVVVGN